MRRLLLLFVLLPLFAAAQNIRVLPISADYAVFPYNDSLAYVEVYVSFFRNSLQYIEQPDSLQANFESACLLTTKSGKDTLDFARHKYRNTVPAGDTTRTISQFVDLFGFFVPFGEHRGQVRISDLNAGVQSEYELNVIVPQRGEKFNLSSIELASKITRSEGPSLYTKNGLRVVPNPRNSFEIFQPMLYYYVELDRLSHMEQEESTYEVHYFVTNSEGDTVKSGETKQKPIAAPTMVEVGGFNTMALSRGYYFLNIRATDHFSGISDTTRKRFFVFKIQKADSVAASAKAEVYAVYQGMTKEELAEEFRMARYITSREEEKVFENLEAAEAMRRFLTEFWRRRDNQNQVPDGMSRRSYLELGEDANSRFSSIYRKGWQTDRGRVLMIYGRPSEIQSFPNSSDYLPYEIWQYYQLEGGAQFIFCDKTGFGQYELIHSTYHKELSNPDWQSVVSKNSSRRFNDFR